MLGSGSLSDFFNTVSTIDTLNKDLQDTLTAPGIETETQRKGRARRAAKRSSRTRALPSRPRKTN